MARKKINENTVNETEAADSLHPGARAQDVPKTMPHRTEVLAKTIGASKAMTHSDFIKWFTGTIDWNKRAGHGVGVGDNAASNHDTVNASPSGASKEHSYGDVKNPTPHLGDTGTKGNHPSASVSMEPANVGNPVKLNMGDAIKEVVKQDLTSLFEGTEGIDETFKERVSTLFEAAIEARVGAFELDIVNEYNSALETELDTITSDLVEGLDNYLDYTTTEWLAENQVAVESSLRNEMATDLLHDLVKVLSEHNVVLPEETEVVETLASKVDELESQIHDLLGEKAELEQYVAEAEKEKSLAKLTEGLTLVEAEKLRELSNGVDADTIETFEKKVGLLKESNFVKKSAKGAINEDLEGDVSDVKGDGGKPSDDTKLEIAPSMRKYADAIKRTVSRD